MAVFRDSQMAVAVESTSVVARPRNRPPSVDALVEWIRSDPLGGRWPARFPSGTYSCREFSADGSLLLPEDEWIQRCWLAFQGGRLVYVSYLLGENTQPTLEHTAWSVGPAAGFPRSTLDSLAHALTTALTRTFGSPGRPDPRGPEGWRTAEWTDVEDFTAHGARVRFYRAPVHLPATAESLVVEHTSNRLLSAMAADSTGEDDLCYGLLVDDSTFVKRVTRETLASLRRADLALSRALSGDRLAAALTTVRTRPDSDSLKHLTFYATHLWLRGLPESLPDDSTYARLLRAGGLREVEGACGDPFVRFLAGRAGEDRWTDAALVDMLDRGPIGCEPGDVDIGEGGDWSRLVIARGERFLRAHPHSSRRDEIAWRVAMAHETAWSLSKGSDDPDALPQYRRDADLHRDAAICLYADVIRRDPATARSRAARRRINRMRLDVDTNCRYYWFFAD